MTYDFIITMRTNVSNFYKQILFNQYFKIICIIHTPHYNCTLDTEFYQTEESEHFPSFSAPIYC